MHVRRVVYDVCMCVELFMRCAYVCIELCVSLCVCVS